MYTLKTDKEVEYKSEYASVVNQAGEEIPKGELEFMYYEYYSNIQNESSKIQKTRPYETGSRTIGGAPVYNRDKSYYVVVSYLGSDNYKPCQGYVDFYIDKVDNGLYAQNGQDQFAFKTVVDEDIGTFTGVDDYSIVGTNTKECTEYVEFYKKVNENGLHELLFKSKFGAGDSSVKTGKLKCYNQQYILYFDDETTLNIDFNAISKRLTVRPAEGESKILTQWFIPKYLNTYVATTVLDNGTDDDPYNDYNAEHNTGMQTEITFINDYGTLRFSAKVNTPYIGDNFGGGLGGYEEWAGVVVVGMERDDKGNICFTLTCYIMNTDGLESEGFNITGVSSLKLRWPVLSDMSTLTLSSGSKTDSDAYKSLITDFVKQNAA